jgi:hypothetical protein
MSQEIRRVYYRISEDVLWNISEDLLGEITRAKDDRNHYEAMVSASTSAAAELNFAIKTNSSALYEL